MYGMRLKDFEKSYEEETDWLILAPEMLLIKVQFVFIPLTEVL